MHVPRPSSPTTATAGRPASVNADTSPSPALSPAPPIVSRLTPARARALAPMKIEAPLVSPG
jgi:hypothetical protein